MPPRLPPLLLGPPALLPLTRPAAAASPAAGLVDSRPWIAPFVHTPAAAAFPEGATRKRPLVYVYEIPPDYAQLMVAVRTFNG